MTALKKRVLLVEDEDLVAMLTEDLLEELGYELGESVATLSAGLEAAKAGLFDLAVLDINLRGSTSFPIAQLLVDRRIPFIFASGYASEGIDRQFDDVPKLQKPFNAESLNRCLTRALERRSPSN